VAADRDQIGAPLARDVGQRGVGEALHEGLRQLDALAGVALPDLVEAQPGLGEPLEQQRAVGARGRRHRRRHLRLLRHDPGVDQGDLRAGVPGDLHRQVEGRMGVVGKVDPDDDVAEGRSFEHGFGRGFGGAQHHYSALARPVPPLSGRVPVAPLPGTWLAVDRGMARILIVYATSYGHTKTIAEAIAGRLELSGHRVDVAAAGSGAPVPLAATYDCALIGSRIQFGRHDPAIVDYVRAHRSSLRAMANGFFSVSMSAAGAPKGSDPNDYIARFVAETGWEPRRQIAFGGALHYRRYGWLLRFVMKQLSRRGGHPTDTSRDHDCTDWAAVARFADRISADLAPVRRDLAALS
jgi:menaquinone-dependent protoporphyrinogen oxidase